MLNITSSQPNLTACLSVNSATEIDAGEYQCMTTSVDHHNAISPKVKVTVTGKILLINNLIYSVRFSYNYNSRPHKNNCRQYSQYPEQHANQGNQLNAFLLKIDFKVTNNTNNEYFG